MGSNMGPIDPKAFSSNKNIKPILLFSLFVGSNTTIYYEDIDFCLHFCKNYFMDILYTLVFFSHISHSRGIDIFKKENMHLKALRVPYGGTYNPMAMFNDADHQSRSHATFYWFKFWL
jgi:hypothetical protein